MPTLSRRARKPAAGDIVEIQLPNGRFAYGRILREGFVGVYLSTSETSGWAPVRTDPYRFVVGVFRDVLSSGVWPVIGHLEPLKDDDKPPLMSIKDPITGSYRVYDNGQIRPPRPGEDPATLEPVAAWDAHHVIDRIMQR